MAAARSRSVRNFAAGVAAALVVVAALWPGACSPAYVIRAGWEEAKILRARRPIPEVVLSPDTDQRTRGKLLLAREAREFAMTTLGLDVGDSYTTYVKLERDTLAMVLSAAHRDRLAARTWWFPIVGRVPYRGFFDLEDAQREQGELEDEGWDTLLRPTAAFSTLGWFSDPLLSTVVRYDEVELVVTVLHELSHNHLFVPGQVRFNESFATWVGRTAAIEFFCTRAGGGPDTVWCNRAQDRWDDAQRFSTFIDGLVGDLEAVYGDPRLSRDEKIARREFVFERHLARFRDEVQPAFNSLAFSRFESGPLNNATLLSRMRYYHRLPEFERFRERHGGSLGRAVQELETAVEQAEDPFDVLSAAVAPARGDQGGSSKAAQVQRGPGLPKTLALP